MRQSKPSIFGLLTLALTTHASPLPQNAGQPLFSVVTPASKTIASDTASTAMTAANSSPSLKRLGSNEVPDQVISPNVYAKEPARGPSVTVSYDNSTGRVTVVFEDKQDSKKKETRCDYHYAKNETVFGDCSRHDHSKNDTMSHHPHAANETEHIPQKVAAAPDNVVQAPAAATSGFRTVPYIGVDRKEYASKIYSRSLPININDHEEEQPSYLNPLNTPAKDPSTPPVDREMKDAEDSNQSPSYLNPLNTPLKSTTESAAVEKRSNKAETGDGRCKWYHLGLVTVCAWMGR